MVCPPGVEQSCHGSATFRQLAVFWELHGAGLTEVMYTRLPVATDLHRSHSSSSKLQFTLRTHNADAISFNLLESIYCVHTVHTAPFFFPNRSNDKSHDFEIQTNSSRYQRYGSVHTRVRVISGILQNPVDHIRLIRIALCHKYSIDHCIRIPSSLFSLCLHGLTVTVYVLCYE